MFFSPFASMFKGSTKKRRTTKRKSRKNKTRNMRYKKRGG